MHVVEASTGSQTLASLKQSLPYDFAPRERLPTTHCVEFHMATRAAHRYAHDAPSSDKEYQLIVA